MRAKLWLFLGAASAATLAACLAFPPGDICGYGICTDGSVGDVTGDGKIDAPPGCDLAKDPKDSPACIDESVGVFVSPTGSDTAPGTKSMPVKTLTAALTRVGPKPRIYICEGAYTDTATITTPVSVYGALKCDWSPGGAKPKITGTKADFVLKVDGVKGIVKLVDLELFGKDGALPGESSISFFGNNADAIKAERCAISAGIGSAGGDGVTTNVMFPDAAALKGNSAPGTMGGNAVSINCPAGGMTVGGGGGDSAFSGDAGLPALGGGAGGMGGAGSCSLGSDGTSATSGPDGKGAAVSGVLGANGWIGNAGADGTAGGPGQGGGGGGGVGGGSPGGGGSGGAGGCGGAAGAHGGSGGSSIAVMANGSAVTLTNCSVTAKGGGLGGKGAAGQSGQSPGGTFGSSTNACRGGNGGSGAAGSAGGGGAGGVSVGILYKGMKPMYGADTMILVGTKGTGGTSPAGGASNGVDGVAQPELLAP